MRIERVVLEHHRNIPLLGLDIVDDAVADRDRAGGDVLEACEHAQKRRLAAAGGANQDDKLAVLDRDRDSVQDFKIAERFPHVADLHRRHLAPSFDSTTQLSRRHRLAFSDFTERSPTYSGDIVGSLRGFGNLSLVSRWW
ncbi:hypothetical protein ACVWXO_009130 [Bradyrhizobium sp. LM2.7]